MIGHSQCLVKLSYSSSSEPTVEKGNHTCLNNMIIRNLIYICKSENSKVGGYRPS